MLNITFIPANNKQLIYKKINFSILSNVLSAVFSYIRPDVNKLIEINVAQIPGEISYAEFSTNKIEICKAVVISSKYEIINAILHEVFHIIQHRVDHIPIKAFVDYNAADTSYKQYYNHPTEIQARLCEHLTSKVQIMYKSAFAIYKKINKLNKKLKPLSVKHL